MVYGCCDATEDEQLVELWTSEVPPPVILVTDGGYKRTATMGPPQAAGGLEGDITGGVGTGGWVLGVGTSDSDGSTPGDATILWWGGGREVEPAGAGGWVGVPE
mgnify:CR=1 FL=1